MARRHLLAKEFRNALAVRREFSFGEGRQVGHGIGPIVEVGGAQTLEKSMSAVRPGGSIYVIGAVAGAGQINPRMINRKGIRLQGIHVGSREMFAAMNRAVERAGLTPVVDRVFPFEEARQAYEHQAGARHFGKIVIKLP